MALKRTLHLTDSFLLGDLVGIWRQDVRQLGSFDELRANDCRRIAHEISIGQIALLESLRVEPVVIAGIAMTEDQPDFAVAIHLRAARRVTNGPVEVVHAVEEGAHVRQHPEAVVVVELDDQRIVGGELPEHVDGRAATPLVGRTVSLCVASREYVCMGRIGRSLAVAVGMVRPVSHQPADETSRPIHGARDASRAWATAAARSCRCARCGIARAARSSSRSPGG